jgi:hypothetical protein
MSWLSALFGVLYETIYCYNRIKLALMRCGTLSESPFLYLLLTTTKCYENEIQLLNLECESRHQYHVLCNIKDRIYLRFRLCKLAIKRFSPMIRATDFNWRRTRFKSRTGDFRYFVFFFLVPLEANVRIVPQMGTTISSYIFKINYSIKSFQLLMSH